VRSTQSSTQPSTHQHNHQHSISTHQQINTSTPEHNQQHLSTSTHKRIDTPTLLTVITSSIYHLIYINISTQSPTHQHQNSNPTHLYVNTFTPTRHTNRSTLDTSSTMSRTLASTQRELRVSAIIHVHHCLLVVVVRILQTVTA
jgi:hypothetical protein